MQGRQEDFENEEISELAAGDSDEDFVQGQVDVKTEMDRASQPPKDNPEDFRAVDSHFDEKETSVDGDIEMLEWDEMFDPTEDKSAPPMPPPFIT